MGYSPQGGKEADMIERVHIQKVRYEKPCMVYCQVNFKNHKTIDKPPF